jgi:aminomethyltransferase
MPVLDNSGREVGLVTSGTYSPTLKAGVALALLEPNIELGLHVAIDIRGRAIAAQIVKIPFVESNVK